MKVHALTVRCFKHGDNSPGNLACKSQPPRIIHTNTSREGKRERERIE